MQLPCENCKACKYSFKIYNRDWHWVCWMPIGRKNGVNVAFERHCYKDCPGLSNRSVVCPYEYNLAGNTHVFISRSLKPSSFILCEATAQQQSHTKLPHRIRPPSVHLCACHVSCRPRKQERTHSIIREVQSIGWYAESMAIQPTLPS